MSDLKIYQYPTAHLDPPTQGVNNVAASARSY